MDPVTVGLIGIGAGLLGSGAGLFGNLWSGSANVKEARKARKTAMYLAKNKHKLEVDDMRNAGLNPILSVTGGSGVSTPAMPVGQYSNPMSGVDIGDDVSDGLQLALAAEQQQSTIDLANANSAKALNDIKNSNAITAAQVSNYASAAELNKVKADFQKMDNMSKSLRDQYDLDIKNVGLRQARQNLERDYLYYADKMFDYEFKTSPVGRQMYYAKHYHDSYPADTMFSATESLGRVIADEVERTRGGFNGYLNHYVRKDSGRSDRSRRPSWLDPKYSPSKSIYDRNGREFHRWER